MKMKSLKNLKLFIVIILFSMLYKPLKAQTKLSPNAKVSIITIGPGKELYSSFGHSGLWVSDANYGIDRFYSWGSFDFRTNNFYVKFLRGTLPYQIDVIDFARVSYYYSTQENRSVTEQVLDLSPSQKQRIFDLCEENYLPQNREYNYKFYYNNCATKVRDMLQKGCGDSLKLWQGMPTNSYRTWMNSYLSEKPWARMAMNMAVGVPADMQNTSNQSMWLPDNVQMVMSKSMLGSKQLVGVTNKIYTATVEPSNLLIDILTHPQVVINLFYILIFVYLYKKSRFIPTKIDAYLLGFNGLCGVFLLLLWVGTDHGVTAQNLHLSVLLPFNLIVAFMLRNQKYASFLKLYFWVIMAGVLAFILFHPSHSVPMMAYVFYLFRYRDFVKG